MVYLVEDMTGGLGKVALKAGNDSMPWDIVSGLFLLNSGGFWRSVPLVTRILFEFRQFAWMVASWSNSQTNCKKDFTLDAS